MLKYTLLFLLVVLCTVGEGYHSGNSCTKKISNLEKKLDNLLLTYKSSGSCPSGWSTYADSTSCYRFVNTPMAKWKDARKTCLNMGGDLVKIESLRENNYVTYLARTYAYKSAYMWIGLHGTANKRFIWVDGSPLSGEFTRWHSGEPNGAKTEDDCVHLFLHAKGLWNDNPCNTPNVLTKGVFVCERSKLIVLTAH